MSSVADGTERVLSASFLDSLPALREEYMSGRPFEHIAVPTLMDDRFLRGVREEILANLHFTQKETDIYRLLQTGDLANLDGLPAQEKGRLRGLLQLRNTLYSDTFRRAVQTITGCGPLSGRKMDMSVNNYDRNGHLVCHDDVVGTRKIAYILYLLDPEDTWDPEDGGALELYGVVSSSLSGSECASESESESKSKSISTPNSASSESTPFLSSASASASEETKKRQLATNVSFAPEKLVYPKWNQISMFAVQPKKSFHAVQEVLTDKMRLNITGWFHAPVEGEEAFSQAELDRLSARGQGEHLQYPDFKTYDFGKSGSGLLSASTASAATATTSEEESDLDLTSSDLKYLSRFIDSQYLRATTLNQVQQQFLSESSIQLFNFLKPELLVDLHRGTEALDAADGLLNQGRAANKLNRHQDSHAAGMRPSWKPVGPPHYRRYLRLRDDDDNLVEHSSSNSGRNSDIATNSEEKLQNGSSKRTAQEAGLYEEESDATDWKKLKSSSASSASAPSSTPSSASTPINATLLPVEKTLSELRDQLFASGAFRRFLACCTGLIPKAFRGEVRRFRPGLDYTLSSDFDTGFPTLDGTLCLTSGKKSASALWASDKVGGYECFMAPDPNNDDPTMYHQNSVHRRRRDRSQNQLWKSQEASREKGEEQGGEDKNGEKVIDDGQQSEDEGGDDDEEEDGEDGGVLLTASAIHNVLTLVMRDEGVLKFIKYVNKEAPGSRWDIAFQYQFDFQPDSAEPIES